MADPALTAPGSQTARERRRWLGPLVVLMLVASIVLAMLADVPDRLPAAALNSTFVLYAMRAVAIFAALFLALLVTYRALLGELPNELSGRGVRYADRDAVDQLRAELSDAIARLQENQQDLRDAVAQIIDDPGDDSAPNG